MTQQRSRRSFSREFKLETVRMVTEQGFSLGEVARDLDINPQTLRRWQREFDEDNAGAFPGKGRLKPEEQCVRELERELERVRQEREILKKALAIFSQGQRR